MRTLSSKAIFWVVEARSSLFWGIDGWMDLSLRAYFSGEFRRVSWVWHGVTPRTFILWGDHDHNNSKTYQPWIIWICIIVVSWVEDLSCKNMHKGSHTMILKDVWRMSFYLPRLSTLMMLIIIIIVINLLQFMFTFPVWAAALLAWTRVRLSPGFIVVASQRLAFATSLLWPCNCIFLWRPRHLWFTVVAEEEGGGGRRCWQWSDKQVLTESLPAGPAGSRPHGLIHFQERLESKGTEQFDTDHWVCHF